MTAPTLRAEHERYARVESMRLGGVPVAAEWIRYGEDAPTAPAPEIVATYGLLELEYAAFRRGAAVMDRPDRATIRVTGAQRVEFLNRMVTQELKGMSAGAVRSAFWLNRKGRIDADLLLCEVPDAQFMLIDVDVHDAARTVKSLEEFIFGEDVQVVDDAAAWARLSVHGPGGTALLQEAGANTDALRALGVDRSCVQLQLVGADVVVARRDQCAGPGLELWVPMAHAAAVWDALVSQHDQAEAGRRRARPAGWYAYNIARIEGGTPLFRIDFGVDNLPHETGVLRERVSFQKGCYLGQEVVARMESLGHPKQRLVALRTEQDLLPTAGSPVFERAADGEPGNPVGAITSSALSPMLGAAPIAFAMVKYAHSDAGATLVAPAEGGRTAVTVQPTLVFVPQPEGTA
ncbi:MAG: aminomethyltransferase family protein [Phycisphaerae bacterium]|nr:aminomethyltransferase family protein [Phycisphaerae bacterium]